MFKEFFKELRRPVGVVAAAALAAGAAYADHDSIEREIERLRSIPTHRADLAFNAQSPKITFTTSTKTLVQILAPTNQRVVVGEFSISFDGTSNTATPIEVDLVRQTSAGTFTNTTASHFIDNAIGLTLQTVVKDTATAEPTDSADVPVSEYVHPQTGYTYQAITFKELKVNGATRLGLRLLSPAAGADCFARLGCVE